MSVKYLLTLVLYNICHIHARQIYNAIILRIIIIVYNTLIMKRSDKFIFHKLRKPFCENRIIILPKLRKYRRKGAGGLYESTNGVPLAEAKYTGYGELDASFAP